MHSSPINRNYSYSYSQALILLVVIVKEVWMLRFARSIFTSSATKNIFLPSPIIFLFFHSHCTLLTLESTLHIHMELDLETSSVIVPSTTNCLQLNIMDNNLFDKTERFPPLLENSHHVLFQSMFVFAMQRYRLMTCKILMEKHQKMVSV